MDNGNTVPTAVAFIAVIAILAVCFILVKINVKSDVGDLSDMTVLIDGKSYKASVENNKTASMFLEQLPLSIDMQDYNENEKYGYIYTRLSMDSELIRKVHAGDILLYGENTLIVAFNTYKANERYTVIGHIDDMEQLDSGTINVKFMKSE